MPRFFTNEIDENNITLTGSDADVEGVIRELLVEKIIG